MAKKISIITVTYNDEELLLNTLENIRKIKLLYDVEYIVVDGEVNYKSWHDDYSDVIDILIVEKDDGIYDAMNKGIEIASGNLIGIINSGDTYEIENFAVITGFKGDVLTGDMLKCFRNTSVVIRKTKDDLRFVSRFMPINHPATFVSSLVYREYGYFDSAYKLAADNKFIWNLILNNVSIEFVDLVLARMEAGGRSERFSTLFLRVKEHYQIRSEMDISVYRNIIQSTHGFLYSLRAILWSKMR